jgi:hypothetical protein
MDAIGATEELAVLTHVGERIDMRSDVGTRGDHVVGRAAASVPHRVAVPAGQRVPELRMIGGLWHANAQLPAEIDDPDTRLNSVEEHIVHAMTPAALIDAMVSAS